MPIGSSAIGRSTSAVLVGPSHFVGFEGVVDLPVTGVFGDAVRSIVPSTPTARARSPGRRAIVVDHLAAHAREHSLEMQLPFLARLAPGLPIVPLVVGRQTRGGRRGPWRCAGDGACAAARRSSWRAAIFPITTTRKPPPPSMRSSSTASRASTTTVCSARSTRAGSCLRRRADGRRHARGAPRRRAATPWS